VINQDVPRYVITDRNRLQQTISSLVSHALVLSGNASKDRVARQEGEIIVRVALEQEQHKISDFEKQKKIKSSVAAKRTTSLGAEDERRGGQRVNAPSSDHKNVELHIQVKGTRMTIQDEEFVDLFDPFTATAGSARPAKFSSIGLGTSLRTCMRTCMMLTVIDIIVPSRSPLVRGAEQVLWRQDLG
jgi:hypothetical protein